MDTTTPTAPQHKQCSECHMASSVQSSPISPLTPLTDRSGWHKMAHDKYMCIGALHRKAYSALWIVEAKGVWQSSILLNSHNQQTCVTSSPLSPADGLTSARCFLARACRRYDDLHLDPSYQHFAASKDKFISPLPSLSGAACVACCTHVLLRVAVCCCKLPSSEPLLLECCCVLLYRLWPSYKIVMTAPWS